MRRTEKDRPTMHANLDYAKFDYTARNTLEQLLTAGGRRVLKSRDGKDDAHTL
jgi:hypothetical protein